MAGSDLVREPEVIQIETTGWLNAHIVSALLGYGFLTLAALASFGLILRERALKLRKRGPITTNLPSIALAEKLEFYSLATSEGILALCILFGIAAEYTISGTYFQITHKSIFTVSAFLLIGGLLIQHRLTGLRGKIAARIGLTAYLLVSLGYPGVKFVLDILTV